MLNILINISLSRQKVVTLEAATVADYRRHCQALSFVQKLHLRARALLSLTQIIPHDQLLNPEHGGNLFKSIAHHVDC